MPQNLCTVGLCQRWGFTFCCHSLICRQLLWHSLSSEWWVNLEMNRCHWRLGLLLFCPLQSHIMFRLTFECVTRVSEKAAGEEPSSGWLAQQEHLTVSILSAIVYAWGDLAARFVKPLCTMSCKENDVLCDPCVFPSCTALDLSYLCLLCWGTFMLFVHCVFTQLRPMDTMMGLFISLTFSMFCSVCFMWLDTINT